MALDVVCQCDRGGGSRSPPCVLPLVPPPLLYGRCVGRRFPWHAGVTAKAGARGALLCSSSLSSSVSRRCSSRLAPNASTVVICCASGGASGHGRRRADPSRHTALPLLSRGRVWCRRSRPHHRCLCPGPGLRLWLDAVHRTGAGADPDWPAAANGGRGRLLLAAYSLGLGIPFLIAALAPGLHTFLASSASIGRVERR